MSNHNQTEDIQNYLRQFSRKYPLTYILESIENLKSLKVLVIGEAIIDEYQFGATLGKVAKEPVIALKHTREERLV